MSKQPYIHEPGYLTLAALFILMGALSAAFLPGGLDARIVPAVLCSGIGLLTLWLWFDDRSRTEREGFPMLPTTNHEES